MAATHRDDPARDDGVPQADDDSSARTRQRAGGSPLPLLPPRRGQRPGTGPNPLGRPHDLAHYRESSRPNAARCGTDAATEAPPLGKAERRRDRQGVAAPSDNDPVPYLL